MEHKLVGSTAAGRAYHPNLTQASAAGFPLSEINDIREGLNWQDKERTKPREALFQITLPEIGAVTVAVQLLPLTEEHLQDEEARPAFEILRVYKYMGRHHRGGAEVNLDVPLEKIQEEIIEIMQQAQEEERIKLARKLGLI